jgi:hypothetical protein
VYQLINLAQCQQRSIPFRWRETTWSQDTQRPQYGKRWWNRCGDRASWRLIISVIWKWSLIQMSFKSHISINDLPFYSFLLFFIERDS